jgi:hypothetical protein
MNDARLMAKKQEFYLDPKELFLRVMGKINKLESV